MPREVETLTNVISFQSDSEVFNAAFFPLSSTSLTYGDVEKVIPNFSGFSLAILNLVSSTDIAQVSYIVYELIILIS